MSPAFQETLSGNEMLLNSQGEPPVTCSSQYIEQRPMWIEIRYYDTVTLRHKDSKVFLHSHVERYPLKYDDGRISSQGSHFFMFPCGQQFQLLSRPAGYWLRPQ